MEMEYTKVIAISTLSIYRYTPSTTPPHTPIHIYAYIHSPSHTPLQPFPYSFTFFTVYVAILFNWTEGEK